MRWERRRNLYAKTWGGVVGAIALAAVGYVQPPTHSLPGMINRPRAHLYRPAKISQIIRDSIPVDRQPTTTASYMAAIQAAVRWATAPWKADNRPFHQARLQIERLHAKMDVPTFMQKVVLPYHRAALKHPTDALIVFRYGYALRLGVGMFPTPYDEYLTLKLIGTPKPPYAWDYARMMYAYTGAFADEVGVGGYIFQNHPEELAAGERLFQQAPKDKILASLVAFDLVKSGDPVKALKGLHLAEQFSKMYPTHYGFYAIIGNYYADRFQKHPNRADAIKNLEAVKKCLQVCAKDPYNNEDNRSITELQLIISRLEQWLREDPQ